MGLLLPVLGLLLPPDDLDCSSSLVWFMERSSSSLLDLQISIIITIITMHSNEVLYPSQVHTEAMNCLCMCDCISVTERYTASLSCTASGN